MQPNIIRFTKKNVYKLWIENVDWKSSTPRNQFIEEGLLLIDKIGFVDVTINNPKSGGTPYNTPKPNCQSI